MGSSSAASFLLGLCSLLLSASLTSAVIVPTALSPTCSVASLANVKSVTTSDGRICTLYTQDAKCMTTYTTAAQYCSDLGHELAPYTNAPVATVLQTLVAGQHFTSWLGEKSEANNCPLMSAAGTILQQGCNQSVRFTCCTTLASTYVDITIPSAVVTSYTKGSYTYNMYTTDARNRKTWGYAKWWCAKHGMELAPHDEAASMTAIKKLCSSQKFTCWVGGTTPSGFCPLISAGGAILYQGCDQDVRWVCRAKKSASTRRLQA